MHVKLRCSYCKGCINNKSDLKVLGYRGFDFTLHKKCVDDFNNNREGGFRKIPLMRARERSIKELTVKVKLLYWAGGFMALLLAFGGIYFFLSLKSGNSSFAAIAGLLTAFCLLELCIIYFQIQRIRRIRKISA